MLGEGSGFSSSLEEELVEGSGFPSTLGEGLGKGRYGHHSSKKMTRPRPASLARYRAESVSEMAFSGVT